MADTSLEQWAATRAPEPPDRWERPIGLRFEREFNEVLRVRL